MAKITPIRFTLLDGTIVTVKKVADKKYDFQLQLPNGNRKTFIWLAEDAGEFNDRKGVKDIMVTGAIGQFLKLML